MIMDYHTIAVDSEIKTFCLVDSVENSRNLQDQLKHLLK